MSSESENSNGTRQRVTPPVTTATPFQCTDINKNDSKRLASSTNTCSSFCGVCRRMALFLCHQIIFGPIVFKLIVYFSIVTIGSLLRIFSLAPDSYFSSKNNILNVYFAKLGWAWTIGLLLPFIYLNLREKLSLIQIISQHLTRLLVATAFWYTITKSFVHIEEKTGACKHENFQTMTRRQCIKGGHHWIEGFDLSGHTFLFIYALLIINEELRAYDRCWKKSEKSSDSMDNQSTSKSVTSSLSKQENSLDKYLSLIHSILPTLLAILTIIWELMLLSTALYFHYFTHKLLAAVIAVATWWFTYRLWFRSNSTSILRPSSPVITMNDQ